MISGMEWVNQIMGIPLCEYTEIGNINVPSLIWIEVFKNINYYVIISKNKPQILTSLTQIMENIVNCSFKFVVLDVNVIYKRQ
jgi:hypothetical protein